MGIKKAVPEPTSKDLSLVSIGFDAWYEHEEGLTPRPEIVEDYKQQTLTLIRLANHYHSELLTLREAVAPKMAEVDEQFGGASARMGLLPPSRTREECQSGIERCYNLTRTAILACETQKRRADHADKEAERLNGLSVNDGNIIERVAKEKLRIVQLFRWWVREYSRFSPEEIILRGDEPRIDDVREIMEWLEE